MTIAARERIKLVGFINVSGNGRSICTKISMQGNAQNITNRWVSRADSATYLC